MTGRLSLSAFASPGLAPFELQINAGQCVTLSGPSGSGKSRLLRAIADLDPHQGDAQLDALLCSQMAPAKWRRKVGYLATESHWWHETVREHFAKIIPEQLSALGFDAECLDWSVERLSSGERQRLALLRLLSNEPEFLLLDEPTANLDQGNATAIEQLLTSIRTKQQVGILWVSHDLEQCRRVGERHLRIEQGSLKEQMWN